MPGKGMIGIELEGWGGKSLALFALLPEKQQADDKASQQQRFNDQRQHGDPH